VKFVNCLTLTAMLTLPIFCAADEQGIAHLQSRWAEIKYATPAAAQAGSFAALASEAEAYTAANPNDPAALIWEGIIRATHAGTLSGLGALAEAKKAKALFERAIELDPASLDGSAYTSLGSLYYQVPGWPIGFGSDKKAKEMLEKGLALNPDGIDSNYFYGDFLMTEGQYAAAQAAFEHALEAPPRPNRGSADAGRRQEALQAIDRLKQKQQRS
jgi:Tfp pilus assembly protein PilF